jgi:hypothetical protein
MKNNRTIPLLLALLIVVLLASSAVSQDSHYWTQQYGTRSTLLGGAVIGSVSDLSATYYNPGALSLIEKPRILLTARVIQSMKYTLTTGLRENVELSNERLSPAPTLIAGRVQFKWLKDNNIAYSFLVRNKAKLEMEGRRIDTRDVIARSDGEESFVGDAGLEEDLDEVWVGLTWSRKIASNLGLGVAQHIAIRNHSGNANITAQALTSANELAITIQSRDYDYSHIRALWKFGAAFDFGKLKLGASITTPSLDLYGDGSIGYNSTFTAQDVDGDGTLETELTSDYQEDLSAEYRSPLSVGVGTAYSFNHSTINVSVEWFDAVEQFEVMEPNPIVSQSSGEITSVTITHAADNVINYGIGLEHSFGEDLAGYASYSTDFSTHQPGDGANLAFTIWDIYHITWGISTKIGKSRLTLGLGYSFGSKEASRPVDFSNASEANMLVGTESQGEFKYRGYRLIFGLSL